MGITFRNRLDPDNPRPNVPIAPGAGSVGLTGHAPTVSIGSGPGVEGAVLLWDDVQWSAGYVVEVGTSSGLSDSLITVVSQPTIDLSDFLPSGTYFVRVRSVAVMGGTVVSPQDNAGPATADLQVTF